MILQSPPRLALLLLLLTACGSKGGGTNTSASASLTPPASEATPQDAAALGETLTRIEELAAELGRPQTFRRLPVTVTNENKYSDHPAACVSNNGVPQFIQIKPDVFEKEKAYRAAGTDSTLFRVVLHEIGHCYFQRQHEAAMLADPGMALAVKTPAGSATPVQYYVNLDATVMVPGTLTLPIPFEKYYVAELLGLTRAHSLKEIGQYEGVGLIRQPWLAQKDPSP